MIRRAALTILLGAATAFAQDIPDRPEKLSFAPIRFETPRARDYKAKLRNGIPAFVAPNGKEGTPLVRVTVSWRGGAYLDPKGKEGLAALFGSQLTQGGTAKLEAAKLEDRLEALAATLTSSCTDDERQRLPPGAGQGPRGGARPPDAGAHASPPSPRTGWTSRSGRPASGSAGATTT